MKTSKVGAVSLLVLVLPNLCFAAKVGDPVLQNANEQAEQLAINTAQNMKAPRIDKTALGGGTPGAKAGFASTYFATCSLYKGAYSPDKKTEYTMDVVNGQFVMPQINIIFQRGDDQYLYWAGLTHRYVGEKHILGFGIQIHGVNGPQASADIVPGKPLEVILQDEKSDSTLRCYNPSAPAIPD